MGGEASTDRRDRYVSRREVGTSSAEKAEFFDKQKGAITASSADKKSSLSSISMDVPVEYEKKGEFPQDELQQLKKEYNLTMRVREQKHKYMEKKIKNLMQEKEAVLKEKRDLMQEREAALEAKQHSDKMLQISQKIQHEYETMMKLAGIDIEDLRDNMIGYTVGPGGGAIKLFSYEVIFPQNAVDIPIRTKFYVSDDIDNLTLPSGLIPVSLPLHCAPGGLKFKFPVVFKMPIWCSISKKCKRPVQLYIYKRQKRGQWQYCDEVSLTDSGFVSFTADSFCEKIPALNSKDLELVKFDLLYFLCKDHLGSFVSVHFVSSDKLAEKLKSEWIKTGYKIIHPPSTKLTVNPGDVLPVNLESKEPEKYKFESAGTTVLKVTMEFYERELYKAFSFLLDPENPGSNSLKFVYSVGDVRHLKRALYQEKESSEHNYDDSPNRTPVFKNIVQIHGDIMVGAGTVSGASDANNARNTEGSQAVGISIEGGAEIEQKSRSLDEQPATSRTARPWHQHKQRNSSSDARSKTTESQSSSQATSSGLRTINQQPGVRMTVERLDESLPGYEWCGAYVITYSFPAGSLNSVSYEAKEFTEYLPRHLFFDHTSIPLLEKAFKAGLLFKIQIIGSSRGEIIWNDEIPHKTNKLGGPDNNGYPDDDHLDKLRDALKAKLRGSRN
ncbi:uncharacterized protein LOC120333287 isoform X2 [Styela clava]